MRGKKNSKNGRKEPKTVRKAEIVSKHQERVEREVKNGKEAFGGR